MRPLTAIICSVPIFSAVSGRWSAVVGGWLAVMLKFQHPPLDAAHSSQAQETDAQAWLLSGLRLWGLVVLTLHLAAFRLPEASFWSVWPYTFLSPWLGWTLALLAGSLIIAPVSRALAQTIQWFWKKILSLDPAGAAPLAHPRLWVSLAALLAGLLFWLARLRHLRWGDSYMLSVLLSYPDLEIRVVYNWQAPLTVFLHQRLWQFVADPLLGWPVETVYAAISILCGMIFVYVLLAFTARLGRTPLESAVLAGLVLTTGSMQLFFGYVENYTVIALGLIVTLFLAWLATQGEIRPVWPALALALTNACHPSTVFLWPGMLVLIWLCRRRGYGSLRGLLLQTILPPVLIAGGVLALMESGGHGLSALWGVDRPGGGDTVWFVPLFETDPEWARYQHYTMFSAAHLLDWSNVHLLISPVGLPLIVMILVAGRRWGPVLFDRQADRDYGLFLGVTAAMYLLLTWLWNPDYGGRKDWDLFAPSAFVYTLLAGWLLVCTLRRENLAEGGLFLSAVSLLHTAAWIFANTHALPRE
ncbi:MAG: hypothetical protein AB1801_14600 [Chloroflexota bacterium]